MKTRIKKKRLKDWPRVMRGSYIFYSLYQSLSLMSVILDECTK